MYLTAVSGMLNEQNIRSEMHSDKTNAVVACARNFGFNTSATIVVKLPAQDKKYNYNQIE